jgi:hypothetical protein
MTAVHNMGRLLRDLGRIEEAEVLGAKAVTWARESLPDAHPTTAAFLRSYAITLTKLARHAEAEAALLEAYGILDAVAGPDHRHTISIAQALVDLYDAWQEVDPNGGYDARAAAWRARIPPPDAPGNEGSGD